MTNPIWGRLIRPENDNGRGIHWSASVYHDICFKDGDEWARWKRELAALNIRYVKVLDDGGDSSLGLCEALWKECGILPIVRLYRHEPEPRSITGREVDTIKKIVAACGIPIPFETKNEPDLECEWRDGNKPDNWWESVIQTSGEDAMKVLDAGGIWLFPAFTHGKTLEVPGENPYYNNMLRMFTDVHGKALLKESGVAIHNYRKNHPLDYPYDAVNQDGKQLTQAEYDRDGAWAWDNQPIELINQWRLEDKNPGDTVLQDWTCFNNWQVWDQWAKDVTGDILPIFTTEGGANIGGRDDRRYPRTTPQMHLDATLAIEQWMMDEAPEQYVACCHWLMADEQMGHGGPWGTYTTWESQCWYTWYFSESQWQFKGQIPTVAAVKAMPSYPRKCGGGSPVVPEPPAPDPPEPPPSGVVLDVPQVWIDRGIIGVDAPHVEHGEEFWAARLVQWHRSDPCLIEFVVEDIDGQPIPWAVVDVINGGTTSCTTKVNGPGNFPLYGLVGSYSIRVQDGKSDTVKGLGLGIPETWELGLTEHAGFKVIFRKEIAGTDPIPEPPPGPTPGDIPDIEDISDTLEKHPTKTYEGRSLEDIDEAIIHHTGIEGATPTGTARYCVFTRDWPGIGYHFWIEEDGVIYQTQPITAISYHCAENNGNTIGIVLEGCFVDGKDPSEAQINSVVYLIGELNKLLGVSLMINGHRDYRATRCPGDNWDEWRKQLVAPDPPPEPPDDCEVKLRKAQEKAGEIEAVLHHGMDLANEIENL